MGHLQNLLAVFVVLAQTATSAPTAPALTAEIIQSIAPGTSTCTGVPDFPNECRTASDAAPHIEKSFSTYGLTTPGEKAAALSLMLYESAEFKYNVNHWPGVPGQGTRNMQSPTFNAMYADAVLPADLLAKAKANGAVGIVNHLRPDRFSFHSAAWFIKTQCSSDVRAGLQAGTQAGWEAYITGCVGTTSDYQRLTYWQKSLAALGG